MIRKLLLRFSVATCFALVSLTAGAQAGKTVTGRVVGEQSDPLSGVTVVEKGKTRGATTNAKGEYSIQVADPNATLVFSLLGMDDRQEKLNGRSKVDVTLYENKTMLDEVVVIGYGTAKRGDLTGAVATVSDAAFNDKQITNMEDALRGQVAGVRVLSSNGEPGESLNIRVRGSGSLNATNAPIYVIDGVVCETADIAPGDIESMDILKDASATAIYGSKGSNGVVMITTKRGSAGKTKVSITANYSVQQAASLLDMMDAYEFAKTMQWGQYLYHHRDATGIDYGKAQKVFYRDAEWNIYEYNMMSKWSNPNQYLDPSNPGYVNTDWQDAMLRQVQVQDYKVSVTGGDKNSNFAVMGGYYNAPGLLYNSGYERMSLRANYQTAIGSKGGNFGLNLNGVYNIQNGLATDANGVTLNMLVQAPTKKESAEDWSPEGVENEYENNNPLYQAKAIKRQTEKTNATLRVYFNIPIMKSFKLSVAGNFINNDSQFEEFFPKDVAKGRSAGGRADNDVTHQFHWNSENLLYFTPKLKNTKHKFDAMAGVIVEQTNKKVVNTESHGFTLSDLNTASMQDGTTLYDLTTVYTTNRMLSFLSRANYSYRNYYFTGTIRFDGSSKFGPDNKWGVFPSGAFMWRISDEPFMRNLHQVNQLKARFSVGATGNSAIPSLQSLNLMSRLFYPTDGKAPQLGMVTDRPSNPYLKWESLLQYDGAIEFALFKSRLTGTVEAYYKKTSDLLFDQPELYSLGYANQWSNIASIANKGLEITLGVVPLRTNKVSWNIDYNMAFNRSKVLSLGGASELILDPQSSSRCTNFGILRVGKPLGNWYGYRTDGLWTKQSQIDALPADYSSAGTAKSNLRPGSTRLKDTNNDGTVNDSDRVILGNSQPDFTGGFTNTVRLYNFTLTVGVEFSVGGKVFNATACELTQLNSGAGRNSLASAKNYWTPTLYSLTTGEVVHQGNEGSTTKMPIPGWEPFLTEKFLEDGSYLRFDNISLSYNVPQHITKKLMLGKLSVFAAVRNAYVFTNYTGYDPDVSVGNGIYADLLPKLDAGSFPRTRSYTLGATIVF